MAMRSKTTIVHILMDIRRDLGSFLFVGWGGQYLKLSSILFQGEGRIRAAVSVADFPVNVL
jgi:hypothetical protein